MASKKSKASILKILIGLTIGIAVGYGIGQLLASSGFEFEHKPSIWWILLSIPIAFYLVIIIHELGHILGGLIMGNEFIFVTAGPLKLSKEEGSLKFSMNRHINLSGGLAMTLPRKVEGFRLRRFIVVFGGPFFSLLSAVICSFLYWLYWSSISVNAQVFVMLFGILSFLIFVITIIPQNVNGMMTDGYQLLMIMKNDEKAQKYADMLHLTALNQQGKSPIEYPDTILEKYAESSIENPIDLAFHQFQYYKELANKDIEKAEHHIQVVHDNADIYPAAFYPDVLSEPYFFYSFIRPDKEKISEIEKLLDNKVPRASELTANMYKGTKAFNDQQSQEANSYFQKVLNSKKDDGFSKLFKELIQTYALT